mmetsp:Transcript_58976/g.144649  ORF Transcript_58976/g.144649 Transcript_58976/m.144649 type:complete len:252 (-) Transcript_58976:568-1323(-)
MECATTASSGCGPECAAVADLLERALQPRSDGLRRLLPAIIEHDVVRALDHDLVHPVEVCRLFHPQKVHYRVPFCPKHKQRRYSPQEVCPPLGCRTRLCWEDLGRIQHIKHHKAIDREARHVPAELLVRGAAALRKEEPPCNSEVGACLLENKPAHDVDGEERLVLHKTPHNRTVTRGRHRAQHARAVKGPRVGLKELLHVHPPKRVAQQSRGGRVLREGSIDECRQIGHVIVHFHSLLACCLGFGREGGA